MLWIEPIYFSGGLNNNVLVVSWSISLSRHRLHLLQSAVCLWGSQLDVDTQRGWRERRNKDEMVRAERIVRAGPGLYSSNTSDSLPGNAAKSWTKNTLESERRDIYESRYTYSQQGVRVLILEALMSLFYNPHNQETKMNDVGWALTFAHIISW